MLNTFHGDANKLRIFECMDYHGVIHTGITRLPSCWDKKEHKIETRAEG